MDVQGDIVAGMIVAPHLGAILLMNGTNLIGKQHNARDESDLGKASDDEEVAIERRWFYREEDMKNNEASRSNGPVGLLETVDQRGVLLSSFVSRSDRSIVEGDSLHRKTKNS